MRKFYARLKDNIWAADKGEMRSLKNKYVKYFLCVIEFFTKYASDKPFKDKKVKQFLMLLSE